MMRRARYVLAACLLLAFWLFPFDRRAGGGEATSGTGWNDGEMPPAFNPYVEDEAEETDETRVVLFEGVSRDIPAYVLDGLRRQGGSLDVAVRDYFEGRRFDTLYTPTGLLSLYSRLNDKTVDGAKDYVRAYLPDLFQYFCQARQLDALRLEYLRRMEERRLMAELGVGTDLGEKNPEQDPLYRLGEADAKGYYDEKGQELGKLIRHRPLYGKRIVRLIADYWDISEGASRKTWPQYVHEKERKMRSMEGEALSSPTHLLFLVETGLFLWSSAPEEAYRCMSLAWVRQCQAHRELSARIVEILRRSGLRENYARAVRKWGGRGLLHTPFPATRLGVFINPGEVFEELFNETYKFRSQVDF